ncbi:FliI/YscN family ATPase [Thermogutta sp.]|uniref:FliI/YscN family ATPase n=1 Tax=Thermogutta sp. TaxID=1962930 RepID=UPI003220912E
MNKIVAYLDKVLPAEIQGTVVQSVGVSIAAQGFPVPVGSLAEIEVGHGRKVKAEVIGFKNDTTILFPLGSREGIRRGASVRLCRTVRWLPVGAELLGRVVDAQGRPIDGKPRPLLRDRVLYEQAPPHPCERPRIKEVLSTGVRAIDGLLTCGKGQRLGIFSAAGVGKSVLLGMMARYTAADVIVVGLVGERGREVNDFIERDLGTEGLKKSIVVVATSAEPAILRVQAAYTASAIAEYFRDQGKDVLLLIDSLTRFALAQREIGLAAGEPPTTRGYPPSVFALLPRLVERAGRSPRGTITAFYTVLVEGDDLDEPVADSVRGLLDGHIVLSRRLAGRGHFPAIDVLQSLSRLMPDIVDPDHNRAAMRVRELLGLYRDHEDVITLGVYRRGSHPGVDRAIQFRDSVDTFLRQDVNQRATYDESRAALLNLAEQIENWRPDQQAAVTQRRDMERPAVGSAPRRT